jgi:anti-sigma regulatory factor (Ser/Thr protein kinase)
MIRVDAVWNSRLLYVLVRDSGAGFNKDELPSPQAWKAAGHHGSGRGLAIVEAFCDSVALFNGGSTIKLGFRL